MRHLIFALMIALLPLRGWLGDAMATQMAVHSVQQAGVKSSAAHQSPAPLATESIAANAGNTSATGSFDHQSAAMQAAMPPDCLGHAAGANTDGASTDVASTDSGSGCPDCAFCQACHTVALTVSEPTSGAAVHISQPPGTYAARFASAEPAPGHKPPIS